MITVFPKTVLALRQRFADSRSGRVLFVSHCLLNENTRYMGGAFCGGVPDEVRDLLGGLDGGIVQMICPERVAWGGIYKPYLYQFHGIARWRGVHPVCRFFLPLYLWVVNWKMRWVARFTAEEIADYVKSGMEVVGVLGVRGSPACGVTCRPDLGEYFEWSARVDVLTVTREEQNAVLQRVAKEGSGVYVRYLKRQLRKRGIDVPFFEFDLFVEMMGQRNTALMERRS